MKFILDYSIDSLQPADYNPRKINETSFEQLKASIQQFGIVKPVILEPIMIKISEPGVRSSANPIN